MPNIRARKIYPIPSRLLRDFAKKKNWNKIAFLYETRHTPTVSIVYIPKISPSEQCRINRWALKRVGYRFRAFNTKLRTKKAQNCRKRPWMSETLTNSVLHQADSDIFRTHGRSQTGTSCLKKSRLFQKISLFKSLKPWRSITLNFSKLYSHFFLFSVSHGRIVTVPHTLMNRKQRHPELHIASKKESFYRRSMIQMKYWNDTKKQWYWHIFFFRFKRRNYISECASNRTHFWEILWMNLEKVKAWKIVEIICGEGTERIGHIYWWWLIKFAGMLQRWV